MKVGERVACSWGSEAVDRRVNVGGALWAADGGDRAPPHHTT